MKIFLSVLVLIFSLQSWTNADNITEFEIEGMSIGDNLLNHITKNNIEKLTENYYKNNLYTAITVFPNDNTRLKFETYDAVVLNFLTNDTNYELQAISGIIIYEDNIIDCTKKSDQIVEEFKTFFVNTEVENNNFEGVFGNVTSVEFNFKNEDKVIVGCYDYLPHESHTDHLRVSIDRKEFLVWVDEKAYK
jgi:hypothetical protein